MRLLMLFSLVSLVATACSSAEKVVPVDAGAPAMREAADPEAVEREAVQAATAPSEAEAADEGDAE